MLKNLLLTLIFLLVFGSQVESQTNSYLNNNPCWQERSICQIAANCYTVNEYNYYINGDTVIGAYQYKQVYKKGSAYAMYGAMGPPPSGNPCLSPPPTYYYPGALNFFIRSNGKKMYYRNLGPSSPDTLLYDFNLTVGSVLPLTYNNPSSSSNFTVTAIDSINTYNGWMKRFKLNNDPGFDFIEGMGYKNGLIELMPPNVMSCGWSLLCYSQNTTAYYPSSGPSCMLTTSVQEKKINSNVQVYPNPSEGKYRIALPEFSFNSKVEIYNLTGQLIKSFVPQKEISEIDLLKEPDGVYFLKYISDGNTRSVKLIKQ